MDMKQAPRKYRRIAAGDYQSNDGVRIYQIPSVYPPAWNAYYTDDHGNDVDIVDGAATYADAKAIVNGVR